MVHPSIIALLSSGVLFSFHIAFSRFVRGSSDECGGISPSLFGVCSRLCNFFMSLPFM